MNVSYKVVIALLKTGIFFHKALPQPVGTHS